MKTSRTLDEELLTADDVIKSEEARMAQAMPHGDAHTDLHSEQGALVDELPGRASDPVIKVVDLAWLELEKADLDRTAAFAADFGFTVAHRSPTELHLRGTDAGSPALVVRKGTASRFVGPAFRASSVGDLARLASRTGTGVTDLPEPLGGKAVRLVDPSGFPVTVVADVPDLPALPAQRPLTWNVGHQSPRLNATQRPAPEPARVQRLGHVVLQTTTFRSALDWYLEHLGLIVSDFTYLHGQRDRGPVMAFIRCDRGAEPADHHTLAMHLGPSNRYVHSAYQVADLDAVAMGGKVLEQKGHTHAWGIGRHILGSQVFDYWRDPDGLMVEHFCDGDRFDSSVEPGWAEFCASGLSQWGPKVTKEFLGTKPSPDALKEFASMLNALREDNELDARRALGLLKSMSR
jgi:catechol 2,3-dioxygenase-like lactoylglutathione lyase family enzyme